MLAKNGLAEWLGCDALELGDCPERLTPADARAATDRAGWEYKRSVACIGVEKGGVGKTFLTINAAAALAIHGVRTLVIDADPQCCATNYLLPDDAETGGLATLLDIAGGLERAVVSSRIEGLDLLPARPELRGLERRANAAEILGSLDGFITRQTGHDAILFDVPPFFGTLAQACYAACDSIVMPVTPDAWSVESISLTMRDVESAARDFGRVPPAFFLLPNRANPNRRSTGEVLSRLGEDYSGLLLPFAVHESAGGLNAMNDGLTVFDRRDARSLRGPITALAGRICPPARKKPRTRGKN